MKQTKAQRAVLKYLKDNYPEKYQLIHDPTTEFPLGEYTRNYIKLLRTDEFQYLIFENTKFLDVHEEVSIRLRLWHILFGITEAQTCISCGNEFIFRNWTILQKVCSKQCISSSDFVKQKKIDTSLNRSNGKYINPSQDPRIKQAKIDTNVRRSGGKYENPSQDPKVKQKKTDTCLRHTDGKYSNPRQDPKVKQKQTDTYLEKSEGKYTHQSQFPEVQQKKRENYLEKSDGKYSEPLQDPKVHQKGIHTCLRMSDGEYTNPSQFPEIKQKKIDTCLEKSDGKFTHPMQDPEVFNKINSCRFKEATVGGRLFTRLQGYEPQALEYMINGAKKYDPYDILQTTEMTYGFPYRKLGKLEWSTYHPEFSSQKNAE